MLNKKTKRIIKNILIQIKLWGFIKKLTNKDKGSPLNKNLLNEGTVFYNQFIKENDLVFDVGANFGNRVEIFIALKANVIAVEPQKKCVDYLNKKYGNLIKIENLGLGSKNEKKQFFEADNSVLSTFSDAYIEKVKNTRHKTSIWRKSKIIQIITMDELIKKYGSPKFIKIDVEGFEYEVLKGLTQTSGIVSFEYNVPELKTELIRCIERLSEIGYELFTFSVGESMKMESKWYNFDEFVKLVSEEAFLKTTFGDVYAK